MGSKHPISLRLKTKENWVNTSYHFCSENELHNYFGIDKIALKIIKHYFQFALISIKTNLSFILAFIVTLLTLFLVFYTDLFLNTYEYSYTISTFVPVMIYHSPETEKDKILKSNKGKGGLYSWVHKESGKIYIGSAFDLSKRLSQYYSLLRLKKVNNYISRALLQHGHSTFSLSILEYIDITGLSKEEARKLILSREQYYLDFLFSADVPNLYNILQVAGSSLGFQHTEDTKALISEAHKNIDKLGENNPMFGRTGENHPMFDKTHTAKSIVKMSGENHPMFGKTHSAGTLIKMSTALSGENHPMFGKFHSAGTMIKMSEAKIGENNPMFGITGENHPRGMLSKIHLPQTLSKMSAVRGTAIYVYDSQGLLVYSFSSARKTAVFFNTAPSTIMKYIRNNKIFKKEWFLSMLDSTTEKYKGYILFL